MRMAAFEQDANPGVSLAATNLFTRTRRCQCQEHSNDKRSLVSHTLDDGRASRAEAPAFAIALKPNADGTFRRGPRSPICAQHRRRLFDLVFPECVGRGVEQGSKPFFRQRAVDPVELGQGRVRANAMDKAVDDVRALLARFRLAGAGIEDDHATTETRRPSVNNIKGLSLCFRSHQMLIDLLRSRHGSWTVPGDVRELLDLGKLVSIAVRQAGGPVFGPD